MIPSYPKIFALGNYHVEDIFTSDIEASEKLDGSQFSIGKIGGVVYCRSKNNHIDLDNPDKMFKIAVEYVKSIKDKIPNNFIFYCEYLSKPKHNVIKYNRVPLNNLALFGVMRADGKFLGDYEAIKFHAKMLDIEPIPLLYRGEINDIQKVFKLIEKDSVLGGSKMEGCVIKNYNIEFMVGGAIVPVMMGKYVSEKFKEVHDQQWKKTYTGKGRLEDFLESFKTEARWQKGVQHLKDAGELENEPKDIGKLIKSIQTDIVEEEEENIKQFLWNNFKDDILRISVKGFAEWYKKHIAEEYTKFKEKK